eukprot:TRINITY_DN6412_c1_g2_i2.p1 TRINITY_DN6412_c1_g2~~TRINITY_DN6412_c1_g2_i2.p1  ORF type:complete len:549 (+),score=136.05 TRINITY_DN6412_c1_g2_i2:48-1694(+)
MKMLILLAGVLGAALGDENPPQWSNTYSLQGMLTIPFAEVEEPFTAWADFQNGKSRIDYYGGMVKTFQRADVGSYGTMAKIVPMTNEVVTNAIDCFQINSTSADEAVAPQSMLPDLTGFLRLGTEYKNDQDCEKWRKEEVIGNKVNRYTMWVREVEGVYIPVHYEMRGYNNLLGSHYDHYYVTYDNFSPETPDSSVFDMFLSKNCHGWPGPGSEHVYQMNPMREFIDNQRDHIDASFHSYKWKHSRWYHNEVEEEHRHANFMHNMRFIHSKNRQGLTYKLAMNHLADQSDKELRTLRGRIHDPNLKYNGGQEFSYAREDLKDIPDTLDWRLYGAVTPVKDQSVCGSCWSFGTVGTLEGTLYLHTGELVRLSQQALVDCSWGFGNNGCDGGEDFRAYQWIMKHGGIPTEDSYGPYLGQDGYCHLDRAKMTLKIKGWVNVTSGDVDALKMAIANHGPVSVAIDASHKSLSFYSNGVYYEPDCNNNIDGLDHAVLAVGYGTIAGQDYWLVKNSWSTYWGNDGYVLMARKDNNCGVATAATYVIPDMPWQKP